MSYQASTVTVILLECFILVSLWVLLYQFLKQQGRLLLRLDNLEQKLFGGLPRMAAGKKAAPVGISVGTAIVPFRLPI